MKILALILAMSSSLAFAEISADGKIRQGSGVGRATPALAAMDLIQVCLGMPLVDAGVVAFSGIENLEFTALPDGKTFAYATCVYTPKK